MKFIFNHHPQTKVITSYNLSIVKVQLTNKLSGSKDCYGFCVNRSLVGEASNDP